MNTKRFLQTMTLGIALAFGSTVAEDKVRSVNWEDLAPPMGLSQPKSLDLDGDGQVTDGEMAKAPKASEMSDATVPELDGKLVKIPAFVVPLDSIYMSQYSRQEFCEPNRLITTSLRSATRWKSKSSRRTPRNNFPPITCARFLQDLFLQDFDLFFKLSPFH